MLEALRKGAGGIVAKIFIGLLVLSFAVWGVADVFTGYGQSSLVEVGDTEISPEEYQTATQEELRSMSGQAGRQLSMSEARALGLHQRVMTRLVGGAAIDSHAKQLELGITDQAVADSIMQEKAFHDRSGKFSNAMFQQILRSNNLTEQALVARERETAIRQQLTQTLGEGPPAPDALVNALNRYEKETRSLRYITVPLAAAGPVGEPTDEDLTRYYENHKRQFTAPAFRKFAYLAVTPEVISKSIQVSEDDLKAEYEKNKNRLGTPERRRVQQITFPDAESAQAAYAKITSGTDFVAVAKERGLSERDIDLGLVTREGMADPAIAAAAFQAKEDQATEPVKGNLSTAILRVTEIQPGTIKLYEDAKEDLRKSLVGNLASAQLLDMHDKIEDERASGASLKEIAGKLNLPYVEIDAMDARGQDPSGKTIDLPESDQMLSLIFQSDVGVENDPLDLGAGGFVWYDVTGTTPERVKPIEEVREEVKTSWRQDAERTKLAEFTQQVVERLRNGETLETIASSIGAEIKSTPPLGRAGAVDLPPSAVAQAFSLPDGGAGSAPANDGKGRVVFQVASIDVPGEPTPEDTKRLQEQVDKMMNEDLIAQYVGGLQDAYGVKINRARLETLTGGGEQ